MHAALTRERVSREASSQHKFPLSPCLSRKEKERKCGCFSSASIRRQKKNKNQEDGVLGFLPLNNPMEEQMGALLRCQNGLWPDGSLIITRRGLLSPNPSPRRQGLSRGSLFKSFERAGERDAGLGVC